MRLTHLDLDALRSFVIGIETGSFAQAADRLGRSTSAVSAQLKKLEDQAETALVRKSGRGLALTESGEVLLSYARRLLSLNDEAISAVRGPELAGWIRLGIQEDFGETVLPQVLAGSHAPIHGFGSKGASLAIVSCGRRSSPAILTSPWPGTTTPLRQRKRLHPCHCAGWARRKQKLSGRPAGKSRCHLQSWKRRAFCVALPATTLINNVSPGALHSSARASAGCGLRQPQALASHFAHRLAGRLPYGFLIHSPTVCRNSRRWGSAFFAPEKTKIQSVPISPRSSAKPCRKRCRKHG